MPFFKSNWVIKIVKMRPAYWTLVQSMARRSFNICVQVCRRVCCRGLSRVRCLCVVCLPLYGINLRQCATSDHVSWIIDWQSALLYNGYDGSECSIVYLPQRSEGKTERSGPIHLSGGTRSRKRWMDLARNASLIDHDTNCAMMYMFRKDPRTCTSYTV